MIRGTVPWLFAALVGVWTAPRDPPKCVQVYYDRVPSQPDYQIGKIHSIFLINLLGHFPNLQRYSIPIEAYEKGQLDRCEASFYLGTYYNNKIPKEFYDDFIATKRRVVWAGYNFWNLGKEIVDQLWGVKFTGLSQLDLRHLDSQKRPTFFKHFDYRGETFSKYGEFDARVKTRFNAAFEISLLDLVRPEAERFVVAWARHSAHEADASVPEQRVPYVLRNGDHWYLGDSPFAFMQEEDRYVIFTDLLFDMLGEKPRYSGPKPALVRLEDVHPQLPMWQLYRFRKALDRIGVPFAISIVPIFADPLGAEVDKLADRFVAMSQRPRFLKFLQEATAAGVSYVYHGVSHQYGLEKNPFTAVTGDDFEFWDMVRNRPVGKDSPQWVLSRLEDGMELLAKGQVRPSAWMTPHYQASPLDYVLFGQLFSWSVGRFIYFPHKVYQKQRLPPEMAFDRAGTSANGKRLRYLSDLRVDFPESRPAGQFFPYEIFGDVYGQRIIPENVGNVQPYMNEQVYKIQTVDGLIRIARRNRGLRDHWASFFLHPFTLNDSASEGIGNFPGDTSETERLITEVRKAGYEFVDLKTWVERSGNERAPDPIEVSIGN